jgi:hypothetical protein
MECAGLVPYTNWHTPYWTPTWFWCFGYVPESRREEYELETGFTTAEKQGKNKGRKKERNKQTNKHRYKLYV